MMTRLKYYYFLAFLSVWTPSLQAHHVLGRPAYSLSADSNTPPSMQVETQIGKYFVTFMAYPAFPKPNEQGRVNLYASRIENGQSFNGQVTFRVQDDRWFAPEPELLGVQNIDDNVYRQGFIFNKSGDYIVIAEFQSDGEPYRIDFPLRIGDPAPVTPLGLIITVIILVLVIVNIVQRRRMQRLQTERHHAEGDA